MDWVIVLLVLLSLGQLCLFFGGTALILFSRQAPLLTRLRWVAVSVAPLIFIVLLLIIFSPIGSGGEEDDLVGGVLGTLLAIAVIAANWMTYSTYRSRLSKSAPKST